MQVVLEGKIEVTWNHNDLTTLVFIEDLHKDKILNDTYVRAGHSIDMMSIGLLQEHMIVPEWALKIKNLFNLNKTTATIHKIGPGHYLPIHRDLYETYKRINSITNEDIYRIIVFLEDWQPGHMLDVNGMIYNNWQAGDYVGWMNDTPHAAYNLGVKDRFTLQITGIVRDNDTIKLS